MRTMRAAPSTSFSRNCNRARAAEGVGTAAGAECLTLIRQLSRRKAARKTTCGQGGCFPYDGLRNQVANFLTPAGLAPDPARRFTANSVHLLRRSPSRGKPSRPHAAGRFSARELPDWMANGAGAEAAQLPVLLIGFVGTPVDGSFRAWLRPCRPAPTQNCSGADLFPEAGSVADHPAHFFMLIAWPEIAAPLFPPLPMSSPGRDSPPGSRYISDPPDASDQTFAAREIRQRQ